ncbi:hypothetical protein D1872_252060 [compost metagenome]
MQRLHLPVLFGNQLVSPRFRPVKHEEMAQMDASVNTRDHLKLLVFVQLHFNKSQTLEIVVCFPGPLLFDPLSHLFLGYCLLGLRRSFGIELVLDFGLRRPG